MKRKFVMLTMLIMVSMTTVSCKNNDAKEGTQSTSVNAPSETETMLTDSAQTENQNKGGISDSNALGDIEVEKELFDVSLTLPAQYVSELNQDELKQKATEGGYNVTINDDGSATYTMTKTQHKELLKEMSDLINSSLSEMVTSGTYPNFTNVAANEDFTNFTVTTNSSELGLNESFSVMALYMYGGMYGIFKGEEVDNIHVDFVNAESGEIIHSADSSQAGKAN